MRQDPSPAFSRLGWLVPTLLILGGVSAWQGLSSLPSKRGPAVGSLPRDGDHLVARPYPVDEWVAGATGTIHEGREARFERAELRRGAGSARLFDQFEACAR